MASVRVICDSNFTKTQDIDKSVSKVLKMFSKHFDKKTAPLNKNSDMECVYFYSKLTPEEIRLMKKILNNNKTLLHFKELVISGAGRNNDYESDTSTSSKKSNCSSVDFKCSLSSLESSSVNSSKKIKKKAPKKIDTYKEIKNISEKLRELADKLDSM